MIGIFLRMFSTKIGAGRVLVYEDLLCENGQNLQTEAGENISI